LDVGSDRRRKIEEDGEEEEERGFSALELV
jgi:hypothetical protein